MPCFGSVCHIFCRNPLWGHTFSKKRGVGVVRMVFGSTLTQRPIFMIWGLESTLDVTEQDLGYLSHSCPLIHKALCLHSPSLGLCTSLNRFGAWILWIDPFSLPWRSWGGIWGRVQVGGGVFCLWEMRGGEGWGGDRQSTRQLNAHAVVKTTL